MRFAEIAFQNTVLYISLSISRMKKGFFIGRTMSPIPDRRIRREAELAAKLYERLDVEAVHKIHMPWEGIYLTGVYIAGRRILNLDRDSGENNLVATAQIDSLVSRILEEIYIG